MRECSSDKLGRLENKIYFFNQFSLEILSNLYKVQCRKQRVLRKSTKSSNYLSMIHISIHMREKFAEGEISILFKINLELAKNNKKIQSKDFFINYFVLQSSGYDDDQNKI